ncbi:hypothetical protein LWI28_003945 [Acer negundo]|uniref:Phytocyanin domain-containing protein n=1 Tax=Acer negundo TaxID=4023 RepID=A0AAD5NPK7_ACENE|nr:hypothetical protein LWI28_003945 [Acer negundo]KAK4843561.1 hypothetical protein QYF36_009893 [Acer negundo]
MASSSFLISFAIVACFAPSILAIEHIVGDDKGWTTNFDYQTWAQGKEFRVGDKLVFNYPAGAHSVVRVGDAPSFQQCLKPDNVETLTSGSDVITLATPGKKWYICVVAEHCEAANQKLAITVLPQDGSDASSPSPNSPPLSAARASFDSIYYGVMAFVIGFLGMLNLF